MEGLVALSILYAGSLFIVAFIGYVFCHAIPGAMAKRWRVFCSVLGFGASALVGCCVLILAVRHSPLAFLLEGKFQAPILILAYVLTGIPGAWIGFQTPKWIKPST
jgi:hypothetical protein